jgi:hypothetical protein
MLVNGGPRPDWRTARAAREVLAGQAGTRVRVRVTRCGRLRSVTLRRVLPLDAVPQWPAHEQASEVAPAVVYLDLVRLSADELERALPALSRTAALVLDLRGYGSVGAFRLLRHLTDTPLHSPSWPQPRVMFPDGQSPRYSCFDFTVDPAGPRIQARVVFVVDGRTIESAETIMMIAEHHGLGAIVGGRTAGVNGNIHRLALPGGYTVTWTARPVYHYDGRPYHGVGIEPTVPCEPTIAGIAAGRDEVLERALELLREEGIGLPERRRRGGRRGEGGEA